MKNSLKQMARTPIKTALFFLLNVSAALLMTLGVCIWQKSSSMMDKYEDQFITIGTVRQRPESFEQVRIWDAEEKSYSIFKRAQYASYDTVEDLDIPDVTYLAGPEQRAYYASYTPQYLKLWKSLNPNAIDMNVLIVEFTPEEDCIPEESVKIRITKVISGDSRLEGTSLWFCDHDDPEPEMLYQDKTYAAYLSIYSYLHGERAEEARKESPMLAYTLEYTPVDLSSRLYRPDGSVIEDPFRDGPEIFEVTDGFYETDAGKRLLNIAKTKLYGEDIQPVTATNETCLLMPFYNGDTYLTEGRDISGEEYRDGAKVCLAPRTFMENNGLSLGDQIQVQLLYTDARWTAGYWFELEGGFSDVPLLDAEGNPLEVFETSAYTVVGIYDATVGDTDLSFCSGADELIVPMQSIKARSEKNLTAYGPMTDATTSFRIPNGTVDEFLAAWEKYGTKALEFTFYDRGYTQLKAGIDNMKNFSLILLAAGVILTGLLLVFYSYLFVTKQMKRTAVERSLGMTRRQCRWSILSGFILIVLIGSMAGAAGGMHLSRSVSVKNAAPNYYDSAYSVGKAVDINEVVIEDVPLKDGIWIAVCSSLLITAAGTVIALTRMNRSLKREPMQILVE
ncbi:MAG: ABC transporter permease [Lachnospiraceae bacterium]|nr:ABC transporter permease [Lachnospiraceae bacterium]